MVPVKISRRPIGWCGAARSAIWAPVCASCHFGTSRDPIRMVPAGNRRVSGFILLPQRLIHHLSLSLPSPRSPNNVLSCSHRFSYISHQNRRQSPHTWRECECWWNTSTLIIFASKTASSPCDPDLSRHNKARARCITFWAIQCETTRRLFSGLPHRDSRARGASDKRWIVVHVQRYEHNEENGDGSRCIVQTETHSWLLSSGYWPSEYLLQFPCISPWHSLCHSVSLGSRFCRTRERYHTKRPCHHSLQMSSLRRPPRRLDQRCHRWTPWSPSRHVSRKRWINAHLHSILLWWKWYRRCTGARRCWYCFCPAVHGEASGYVCDVWRWCE